MQGYRRIGITSVRSLYLTPAAPTANSAPSMRGRLVKITEVSGGAGF